MAPCAVTVPAANAAPQCVAVWADASGVLVAVASGLNVAIASADGTVQQLLGPHCSEVRCVAWGQGRPRLAVGAGDHVTVYVDHGPPGQLELTRVVELAHREPVSALAWIHLGGREALWCAGENLRLWAADREDKWALKWERELAQSVHLAASSASAPLLATAGEHDRLPKVWAQEVGADSDEPFGQFSFCYLRHSSAVQSMEWRPAPWRPSSGNAPPAGDPAITPAQVVHGPRVSAAATPVRSAKRVPLCRFSGQRTRHAAHAGRRLRRPRLDRRRDAREGASVSLHLRDP